MKKLILMLTVLLLVVFNQSTQAYAWFVNFGGQGYHDRVIVHLPVRSTTIFVGGSPYYYYDGVYYSGTPNHYVAVQPPMGAIVSRLPGGREKIWINGRYYFRHHGIYYIRVRGGFEVVEMPRVVIPPSALIVIPAEQQVFKINIPNFNGGYTFVSLRRSGRGFVGPQGEFYGRFPTVGQLRVIYAR